MSPMLLGLGIILTLATSLAVLLRRLRLPLILSYILAGVLLAGIGPWIATYLRDWEQISQGGLELFSSLGIALLLFMVGIELDFREVKEIGPVSLVVGLGQVLITSAVGFLIAFFGFHFSKISSLYISVALTFSSTIIIIRLLGEKGDLNSLYGRISVGMLLVQDLVAILALVLLAGLGQKGQWETSWVVAVTLLKTGLLLLLALLLAQSVIPWVFEQLSNSSELILLGVLSWAIIFALFAQRVGFTLEVGAFLAGLTLAASPYRTEIGAKIKPLRDFFIILFFIYLGTSIWPIDNLSARLLPALVFSLFVLIGNPLILLSIMGLMGYHRRVSFLTGLTVAQISEFSLIVAAMGGKLGHLESSVVGMITMVGVITITLSTFLIHHGDQIYEYLQDLLKFFERDDLRRRAQLNPKGLKNHAILYGYGRMGHEFARKLYELGIKTLVVDYDPMVIKLSSHGLGQGARETAPAEVATALDPAGNLQFLYGDASDLELLSDLGVENARLLISTVPDYETNIFLTRMARRLNEELIIIVRASNPQEAKELAAAGAGFVVIPEIVAAHAVGRILEEALG